MPKYLPPTFNTEAFSTQLRTYRKVNKLSQEEFGKLFGLSPTMIGHYETQRNVPSVEHLFAMCARMQVSSDLFNLSLLNRVENAVYADAKDE